MKKRSKFTLCLLIAFALLVSTFNMSSLSATPVNTNSGQVSQGLSREVVRERVVDGTTVLFSTTLEYETAITRQELVDIGGVPVLITTYAFDGFEYEVFQLMQYSGRGVLSVLPAGQEVTLPSFVNDFMEFNALRYGGYNQALQDDFQDIGELSIGNTASGHYSRTRMMSSSLPGNSAVWYDLSIQFDWEMRDNTNFGNPLWDWQRVGITGLIVHVFPWGSNVAQNLESIVIDVVARTHGSVGISYSFSWPPSVSLSPGNNTSETIISREFPNSVGIVARIIEHGQINLDRTISAPLNDLPGNGNWVSLEAYASFWLSCGFHSRLVRTGITFRRNFAGMWSLGVDSFVP